MVHATLCFVIRVGASSCVLLGKKKRGFGMGKYNGIGGKLDPGESPEACIIREVHEEVGLTIPAHALRAVGEITFRFPFEPSFDHFVHVFIATQWDGDPVETAEMEPHWFACHDIPYEKMWQDDAYWLPIVLHGKTIRAEFTFAQDNETVTSWNIHDRDHVSR
ncbi:8-oxo-dGTP diphosphatase [Candidatus Bipolaricaulota bacterium]|jgi:8-oxo-dGTP diphosphatase|nr:8-oxo-dGTP diphosphatase [Candidatus Bipolaricaulota bacterium]TFH09263.1 MAG: 8-oxo-dGTP diphosphatase [Candidatus Atribacteria bacterium]